ncbi:MAG: aminotransferase class IV [Proteobacteria bacterium]|nr:aminotransferase class IV [Pseudomonadota bacterium]
MDRGFLFGDGAYEMIPVHSRRPFRLGIHLKRFDTTMAGIRLGNPHSAEEWTRLIAEVILRNVPEDQSVYLQVTRGADMTLRNHAFPKNIPPTVFIMSEPLVTPDSDQRERGVDAVSAVDFSWLRCDLKTIALLANCLLRQQAMDAGCIETLLFRDGLLTEGTASNIFVVRDGVLLAPPKGHLMLSGITYDIVLELATANGLPHEVREIREDEVRAADEIWLASSTKEVLPIVRLDGQPVGTGSPGPVFACMYDLYQKFKATVMHDGC